MRLEHHKGSLHASNVQRAFLRALRAHLPEQAFAQLDAMPRDREEVERWAATHGINAPCVVDAFECFCAGGWSKHGHYQASGWSGPAVPDEWRRMVADLNARTIDPWASRGVYADEKPVAEAGRGQVLGVDQGVIESALARHLGPVAADPDRESWEDFRQRARLHWLARVRLATSFGFTPAGKETEWRNLARDISWLLRHQVNNETYEQIAGPQDRDDAIDPDTVKKAVDRLIRAIGIKRTRGPRAKRSQ
jgi:hypothetical protein